MKKMKNIVSIIIFLGLFSFINSSMVFAASLTDGDLSPAEGGSQTAIFTESAGIRANITIESILATVISAFLGLLGIIFIILIISAGFKWMNAKDKAEEINKAKDTITRAIIGLIIVASAYAITYFVFKSLDGASSGNKSNNSFNSGGDEGKQ